MGRFQDWRRRQHLAAELAAKALGTQPDFAAGRYAEVLDALRAWTAQAEAGLGADHDVTLELQLRLATALGATGDTAGAAAHAGAVVAVRDRLGTSQVLLQAWPVHAAGLDLDGRHSEAADAWGGLAALLASLPGRAGPAARVAVLQAYSLTLAGRCEEAARLAERFLEPPVGLSPAQALRLRLAGLEVLSAVLTDLGRPADAESTARQGLVACAGAVGEETDEQLAVFQAHLALALSAQGHDQEAVGVLASAAPTASPDTAATLAAAHASALLALGRRADAADLARDALAAVRRSFGEQHYRVRALRAVLVRAEPGAVESA